MTCVKCGEPGTNLSGEGVLCATHHAEWMQARLDAVHDATAEDVTPV